MKLCTFTACTSLVYYVSATSTCCDTNITEYKRSTGVHTLPNTLLIVAL